jgi:hypothetical protein
MTTEAPVTEKEEGFVEVRENRAREAARNITVREGGAVIVNLAEQIDYAKYMASSKHAVPAHLRDNVGACIAVVDMSLRWGFAPYQVARLCYLVNDMLAFESQLIHAVIEKFAPLKYRLRPTFVGEGNERVCIITGHFKGEVDPLEYKTPPVGKIEPKRSPLWKSDPDQQLFYFATQRWARRYCPDIILGVYDHEELDEMVPPYLRAKDVTPSTPNLAEPANDDVMADIDQRLSDAAS